MCNLSTLFWKEGAQMNNKIHYKMYKSGKHWMFSAITVSMISAGITFGTILSNNNVHADSTENTNKTPSNPANDETNKKQASTTQTPENPASTPNNNSDYKTDAQSANLDKNNNEISDTSQNNKSNNTQVNSDEENNLEKPSSVQNNDQTNTQSSIKNDNNVENKDQNIPNVNQQASLNSSISTQQTDKNINEISTNDNLNNTDNSNGLNINVINQAPNDFTYNQGSTMTISVAVGVVSKDVVIDKGDTISFTISGGQWDTYKSDGGLDYGYFSSDPTAGTVTFTFTKSIFNTIGNFGFNINVLFKDDIQDRPSEQITSKLTTKNGSTLIPVTNGTFTTLYNPTPPTPPVVTSRPQAPGAGTAAVKYTGSDVNDPIKIDYSTGETGTAIYGSQVSSNGTSYISDQMTCSNILTPDQPDTADTGRKYTITVSGPEASINIDSFHFNFGDQPSWYSYLEFQKLTGITLNQVSDNSIIVYIPDGFNDRWVKYAFNVTAPDTSGTYTYKTVYSDNEDDYKNQPAWYWSTTMVYQAIDQHGFLPTITAP